MPRKDLERAVQGAEKPLDEMEALFLLVKEHVNGQFSRRGIPPQEGYIIQIKELVSRGLAREVAVGIYGPTEAGINCVAKLVGAYNTFRV